MDTSEQYIKMRGKAIPELGMGTPPVKSPPCFITDNVWVDAVGNWYLISDEALGCQLERQDQLQEMCGDFSKVFKFNPWGMITGLFHHIDEDKYYFDFTSMEQLWLAFVMKLKYNNIWDGEEWVRDG